MSNGMVFAESVDHGLLLLGAGGSFEDHGWIKILICSLIGKMCEL